MHNA
jgi:hypothetical protein